MVIWIICLGRWSVTRCLLKSVQMNTGYIQIFVVVIVHLDAFHCLLKWYPLKSPWFLDDLCCCCCCCCCCCYCCYCCCWCLADLPWLFPVPFEITILTKCVTKEDLGLRQVVVQHRAVIPYKTRARVVFVSYRWCLCPTSGVCVLQVVLCPTGDVCVVQIVLVSHNVAFVSRVWCLYPAGSVCVSQVALVSHRWCLCPAGGVCVPQVVFVSRRWCLCPIVGFVSHRWDLCPAGGVCAPQVVFVSHGGVCVLQFLSWNPGGQESRRRTQNYRFPKIFLVLVNPAVSFKRPNDANDDDVDDDGFSFLMMVMKRRSVMVTLSLLSPLMMIIDEDRGDDDRRGLHNALEHISMSMSIEWSRSCSCIWNKLQSKKQRNNRGLTCLFLVHSQTGIPHSFLSSARALTLVGWALDLL